jgi:phosphate transport system substrate-binding protein
VSRRLRLLLAGSAAAAALCLPACSVISSPAVTGTVTETGSTLMLPLLSSWQVAYHQKYPHTLITTAGAGSGTGILDAATGVVTAGVSDAYLPPSVPAIGLENIPLAVAAVAVIYNLPGVRVPLHLNGRVLAGMFSGKITSWADPRIRRLNPGVRLPAYRVVTVHRADSSGSTDLFTTYMDTAPAVWPLTQVGTALLQWPAADRRSATGSSAVLAACQHARGCLSYIGVSYLSQVRAAKLGVAALAGGSGQYALPSRAEMRAALGTFAAKCPPTGVQSMVDGKTGYPLINYEYAIVRAAQPDAAQARITRSFLDWAITSGSQASYLTGVGFVPLPANVRLISTKLISNIR